MRDVKIRKGFAENYKGEVITKGTDLIAGDCHCGFDCCYGFIKLPNYLSISGDTEDYAMYLVDGEWVIESQEDAKVNITALKAIVPVELPTTPITNGAFRFGIGNSDSTIPYLSGNVYQFDASSVGTGVLNQFIGFRLSGVYTSIVITGVSSGYTIEDSVGPISSFPHTVPAGGSSDYSFILTAGNNTAPASVDINVEYLGQPYIIRLLRSV